MISNNLLKLLRKILKLSKQADAEFMLMGGLAVSVWGNPRATYDLDGVIRLDLTAVPEFLKSASETGLAYDRNRPVKSIRGLSFITLTYSTRGKRVLLVDLFLARGDFMKTALLRKRRVKVLGIEIPVISPEDLILQKLLSGRTRDIEDAYEILLCQKGKLDIGYLKKWAAELGISSHLKDELTSAYGHPGK